MNIDLISGFVTRSRLRKTVVLVVFDVAAMILALYAALAARVGELRFGADWKSLVATAVCVSAGLAALHQMKIYRNLLRFTRVRTFSLILVAASISSLAWILSVYFLQPMIVVAGETIAVPRSMGLIYCGFAFVLLFIGRSAMALTVSKVSQGEDTVSLEKPTRNVLIYGANSAGIVLAESVTRSGEFRLCGFVDDDPSLNGRFAVGTLIQNPEALPRIIRDLQIDEVLLALPKASRTERRAAISRLDGLDVVVRTVPPPDEIASGRFTVSDVRAISVEDLLRRDPVTPLAPKVRENIQGKSILVTGAGGSIGSEICRQLLKAEPGRLVLMDHTEFALFTTERELQSKRLEISPDGSTVINAVVGSILNEKLVRDCLDRFGIQSIYHAAAYKHVPLLELNEVVGVENNVFGTLALARAAVDCDVSQFVMISTDKAVRPKGVMGASKRAAELIVQGLAESGRNTRFGIVRFGNVLDSSGSVVQQFRSQIMRGGPVTVTHPEITRYFMSIPEATHLVLEAGAMAERGEVFVLDMGKSIRIADLARDMIRLSGLSVRDDSFPNGDIEITYVGLRPGEKLYEELFVGSEPVATSHPRIRMAIERSLSPEELAGELDDLGSAIVAHDAAAVRTVLTRMVQADAGDPVPMPRPDLETLAGRA